MFFVCAKTFEAGAAKEAVPGGPSKASKEGPAGPQLGRLGPVSSARCSAGCANFEGLYQAPCSPCTGDCLLWPELGGDVIMTGQRWWGC